MRAGSPEKGDPASFCAFGRHMLRQVKVFKLLGSERAFPCSIQDCRETMMLSAMVNMPVEPL